MAILFEGFDSSALQRNLNSYEWREYGHFLMTIITTSDKSITSEDPPIGSSAQNKLALIPPHLK
jgi:hypothetical protein